MFKGIKRSSDIVKGMSVNVKEVPFKIIGISFLGFFCEKSSMVLTFPMMGIFLGVIKLRLIGDPTKK